MDWEHKKCVKINIVGCGRTKIAHPAVWSMRGPAR